MTGSIIHHRYCIAIAAPPSAKPASPIQAVIHAVTDITSIKLHASDREGSGSRGFEE